MNLPGVGCGRVYTAGIAVWPTRNLVVLGAGRNPAAGINALGCVNYDSSVAVDLPDSLASSTWELVIKSLALPLKTYIFAVSRSAMLMIIPC